VAPRARGTGWFVWTASTVASGYIGARRLRSGFGLLSIQVERERKWNGSGQERQAEKIVLGLIKPGRLAERRCTEQANDEDGEPNDEAFFHYSANPLVPTSI